MSEINIDESMVGWTCKARDGELGKIEGFTRAPDYPIFVAWPEGNRTSHTTTGRFLTNEVDNANDIVEVWPKVEPAAPATQTQVAGDHYKNCAIQPIEYIEANGLGYHEGNVIKYITRHGSKGGVDDLRKARHYIDMLIEFKYGEGVAALFTPGGGRP